MEEHGIGLSGLGEPQVSVGGMLDKNFGNNIHKNIKYRRCAHKKKEYLGVHS
jgi:hypothetical protein